MKARARITSSPLIDLVPLDESHAAAMTRWMQVPEIRENVGLAHVPTLETTLRWIGDALRREDLRAFAILTDGTHVGNLVFDRLDRRLGTARLSLYVGETTARGRGVATEAVQLGLDRMFGREGLHKVWLIVHEENEKAIRVYERVGFRKEGFLRDEFQIGNRRLSVHYMGILRTEHRAPAAPSTRSHAGK